MVQILGRILTCLDADRSCCCCWLAAWLAVFLPPHPWSLGGCFSDDDEVPWDFRFFLFFPFPFFHFLQFFFLHITIHPIHTYPRAHYTIIFIFHMHIHIFFKTLLHHAIHIHLLAQHCCLYLLTLILSISFFTPSRFIDVPFCTLPLLPYIFLSNFFCRYDLLLCKRLEYLTNYLEICIQYYNL